MYISNLHRIISTDIKMELIQLHPINILTQWNIEFHKQPHLSFIFFRSHHNLATQNVSTKYWFVDALTWWQITSNRKPNSKHFNSNMYYWFFMRKNKPTIRLSPIALYQLVLCVLYVHLHFNNIEALNESKRRSIINSQLFAMWI